jgi:hypothetical protein
MPIKKGKRRRAPTNRYAARLLFQFRAVTNGRSAKRRLCEDRIIVVKCANARAALKQANARGRAAQHRYDGSAGGHVRFEFVGVTHLLHLGVECEPDEVFYALSYKVRPMERKRSLIPQASKLNAVIGERRLKPRRRGTQ